MSSSPTLTSDASQRSFPKARLSDKVAVVTGGSGGIGRAICLAYAAEGAKIVVGDIKDVSNSPEEKDVTTVDLVKKQGGQAFFVKTDVSNSDSVDDLVKQAVSRWGRIDIMVNNAGISAEADDPRPVWEFTNANWDRTHAVNSTGVFYGVRAAAAQMIKQDAHPNGDKGWIINLASVYGLVASPNLTAYVSSKHLVMGLTKTAALDLAPHRVHVNAICPGYTASSMTKSARENPAVKQYVDMKQPFRGWGEPEDIARVAVFLASDDARWVSGIGVPVDGGYTAQ